MRRIDRHAATALALAGVLAGAAVVAPLAAALALARVMAFTDVVFAARFLAGVRHLCELGASQEAAGHAQHHLAEITTIHSHVIPLMSETDPLSIPNGQSGDRAVGRNTTPTRKNWMHGFAMQHPLVPGRTYRTFGESGQMFDMYDPAPA